MMAVVPDSSPSAAPNDKLYFALGNDKAMWTITGDGDQWLSDWKSLGGSFMSQPAAVTSMGGRTDILTVETNMYIRSKTLRNGVWDPKWLDLRIGLATAPPTVCSHKSGVFNIWVRGSDANLWQMNWADTTREYSEWMGYAGALSSAPVSSCYPGGEPSVVAYGAADTAFNIKVSQWNSTGKYMSGWYISSGNFSGDPASVSSSPNRIDYFGVGTDRTMYHVSWNSTSGFSTITDLGGEFQSSPGVISVRSGRVDVLGIGLNDQLLHKALVGSSWSLDWEDLGGSFHSAPVAISLSAGKVIVYGLANNGTVFHGSWQVGSDHAWTGDPQWTLDGGNMTTQWFFE
jgi:hypothetical protein